MSPIGVCTRGQEEGGEGGGGDRKTEHMDEDAGTMHTILIYYIGLHHFL